jgi:hypothetical protein
MISSRFARSAEAVVGCLTRLQLKRTAISTIDASPHEPGTVLVAASHWQIGDYAPYAYLTRDYGQTWTRISGNLPARGWVHVVRQDPRNPSLLYAGTEFGGYASWNLGRQWHSLRNGLSAAPVRDLLVHPRDNDLIIATHGRGLYILDDLTPLQRLGEAMASDLTLFEPRPATRWVIWNADGNLGQKVWRGENPPYGAVLSYFVRDTARNLRVTIRDSEDRPVRTLRDSLATPGVNRIVWDLRYDSGVAGGGPGGGGGGGGGFGFGGGGPQVVPGSFTVTLAAGGAEVSRPLTVELDPRASVSREDLVAQRDAALGLRDLGTRVNGLVARTSNLIEQLTNLAATLRQNAPDQREAIQTTQTALQELRDFRDSRLARPLPGLGYRQYPRLREEVQSLYGMVSRSLTRPTDAQILRTGELESETTAAEARLGALVNGPIARLNALLKDLPRIVVPGGRIS